MSNTTNNATTSTRTNDTADAAIRAIATRAHNEDTPKAALAFRMAKTTDRETARRWAPWLAELATDAGFKGTTKDELMAALRLAEHHRALSGKEQNGTLARYRGGYTKSHTSKGASSLHNGDDLAKLLEGLTPEHVALVAENLKGLKMGTLLSRYATLNPGQVRMNSGNQIRNLIKKETNTVEDVANAISETQDAADKLEA